MSALVRACGSRGRVDASELAVIEAYAESLVLLLLQHPLPRMQAAGAVACDVLIESQDSFVDHSKLNKYTEPLLGVVRASGGEEALTARRAACTTMRRLISLADPASLTQHANNTLPVLLGLVEERLAAQAPAPGRARAPSTLEAPPSSPAGAAAGQAAKSEEEAHDVDLALLDDILMTLSSVLHPGVGSAVFRAVLTWLDAKQRWTNTALALHILRRMDRHGSHLARRRGGNASRGVTAGEWHGSFGPPLALLILLHVADAAAEAVGGGDALSESRRSSLMPGTTPMQPSVARRIAAALAAARVLVVEGRDTLRVLDMSTEAVEATLPVLVATASAQPASSVPGEPRSLSALAPADDVAAEARAVVLALASRLRTAHDLHRLASAVGEWYGDFQEELLEAHGPPAAETPDGDGEEAETPVLPSPMTAPPSTAPGRQHVLGLILTLLRQVSHLRWLHSDGAAEVDVRTPGRLREAVQVSNSLTPVPLQDVLVEVLVRDAGDAHPTLRLLALQCLHAACASPVEVAGIYGGVLHCHGGPLHPLAPEAATDAADAPDAQLPVQCASEASLLQAGSSLGAVASSDSDLRRTTPYPYVIRQLYALPLTPLQLLRVHNAMLTSLSLALWREDGFEVVEEGAERDTVAVATVLLVTRIAAALLQRCGVLQLWFGWPLALTLAAQAGQTASPLRSALCSVVATALAYSLAAPAHTSTLLREGRGQPVPAGVGSGLAAVEEGEEEGEEEGAAPDSAPQALVTALTHDLQSRGLSGALRIALSPDSKLIPDDVLPAAATSVALQLSATSGGLRLVPCSGASSVSDPAGAQAAPGVEAALTAAAPALLQTSALRHIARRVLEAPARYSKRVLPFLPPAPSAAVLARLAGAAPGLLKCEVPASAGSGSEHVVTLHCHFPLLEVLRPLDLPRRLASSSLNTVNDLVRPRLQDGAPPATLLQPTVTSCLVDEGSLLAFMAHTLQCPLLPLPAAPLDVEEEVEEEEGEGLDAMRRRVVQHGLEAAYGMQAAEGEGGGGQEHAMAASPSAPVWAPEAMPTPQDALQALQGLAAAASAQREREPGAVVVGGDRVLAPSSRAPMAPSTLSIVGAHAHLRAAADAPTLARVMDVVGAGKEDG